MATQPNSSFSMYLISNASADIYGDKNTLAYFTNVLPRTYNLQGQWEVALSEIQHSSIIHNVTDTKILLFYPLTQDGVNWVNRGYGSDEIDITPGLYESVDELLIHIRNNCHLDEKFFTWYVNKQSGKINITLPWGYFFHCQTSNILNLLGFKPTKHNEAYKFINLQDTIYNFGDVNPVTGKDPDTGIDVPLNTNILSEGEYPVDLLAGTTALYIYTDLIAYQTVGDIEAPLLAFIPFDIKLTKTKELNIDRPIKYHRYSLLDYKDLMAGAFHTIRIEIRDDTGQLVPFSSSSGRTIIKLHFRPKANK